MLETVYVKRRDRGIFVHDLGETWFCIVGHPGRYAPWSDEVVEHLAAERNVAVVREHEAKRLIALRLEHELSATDDPKRRRVPRGRLDRRDLQRSSVRRRVAN